MFSWLFHSWCRPLIYHFEPRRHRQGAYTLQACATSKGVFEDALGSSEWEVFLAGPTPKVQPCDTLQSLTLLGIFHPQVCYFDLDQKVTMLCDAAMPLIGSTSRSEVTLPIGFSDCCLKRHYHEF